MKQLVRSVANRFGFDITRKAKPDISLYSHFPDASLKNKNFYNIGAGKFKHKYWTNIDVTTKHYKKAQNNHPFIEYNLMDMVPLPLESSVAELVYTSHAIEHVSDEAVQNIFNEAYRILKPGGAIRITAPDAWLEFQAYRRNDRKFWYWIDWYSKPGTWENFYRVPLNKASIHQIFLNHFASQICEIDIDNTPPKKYSDAEIHEAFSKKPELQTLDYFTKQCRYNPDHPENHMNWWTREKTMQFLKEAGFSNMYVSGWGQSLFPPFRNTDLFDSTHPKTSFYVEAIK